MNRKLATTFSMAVSLLAISFNTFAGQPEFRVDGGAYNSYFDSCSDFDIGISGVWTMRLTDFFDENGDLVRTHIKGEEHDLTFYNMSNSNIYVESSASNKAARWSTWVYPQAINPDSWCNDCPAFHESGIFWRFKLKGYGWMIFNVGYHYWDPFVEDGWTQHGINFEDPDMVSILCDQLTPE